MRSRFETICVACALVGAGPLLSATAFADADSLGKLELAQDIVIERDPDVRLIEPERELRIIERKPEIRVEIEQPGHYERQRVLVREGYFETYNVWVPKERKGMFGRKSIPGHYEARERWVPPQYEYRDVWVSHR